MWRNRFGEGFEPVAIQNTERWWRCCYDKILVNVVAYVIPG